MPIEGARACVLPVRGFVLEPDARTALGALNLKDRLTATPFGHNDIRELSGEPSRRIRFRALSPSRTGVGAPRSRIDLWMIACSIATVAVIGPTRAVSCVGRSRRRNRSPRH
jgi:hypothetical protein